MQENAHWRESAVRTKSVVCVRTKLC